MEKIIQTEAKIQSDICRFYNNNFCLTHNSPRCLIMSIPNGGNRSFVTASLSKSTGEYTGASDLVVIHFGKVMFVEVKVEKGVQSPAQKLFQAHVESMGFPYYLVRSLDEFKAIICQKNEQ